MLTTNLAVDGSKEMKDEDLKALFAEDAALSFVELAKQLAVNHTTLTLTCIEKDPEEREVGPTSTIRKSYWRLANTCILLQNEGKRKSFLQKVTEKWM